MISGIYEHRIDLKGRVAVPAKFRKVFHGGLVLARGLDGYILAYTLEEWQKISEKFANLPTTLHKNRRLIRSMFAWAFSVEFDRQGRIALPLPLRQDAQIKDVVIMVGGNKYLEIWSKESWEKEEESIKEEAWLISERTEFL